VRKSRSQCSDSQEIPSHLRQVLEACFDRYDEYQRQRAPGMAANADDEESMALGLSSTMGRRSMSTDSLSCLQSLADAEGGEHAGGQHQLRDFHELAVSKNGYASGLFFCVLPFFPRPKCMYIPNPPPCPCVVECESECREGGWGRGGGPGKPSCWGSCADCAGNVMDQVALGRFA
jgi:hypothetical protein